MNAIRAALKAARYLGGRCRSKVRSLPMVRMSWTSAEIDLPENARTVECAEPVGGDPVLQLLLQDGGRIEDVCRGTRCSACRRAHHSLSFVAAVAGRPPYRFGSAAGVRALPLRHRVPPRRRRLGECARLQNALPLRHRVPPRRRRLGECARLQKMRASSISLIGGLGVPVHERDDKSTQDGIKPSA